MGYVLIVCFAAFLCTSHIVCSRVVPTTTEVTCWILSAVITGVVLFIWVGDGRTDIRQDCASAGGSILPDDSPMFPDGELDCIKIVDGRITKIHP